MYQEFFLQKGMLVLPIVALMSFILSFAAILWWSLRATQQPHYQQLAELPLTADRAVPPAGVPKEGARP